MKKRTQLKFLMSIVILFWVGNLFGQAYQTDITKQNQASRYVLGDNKNIQFPVNILGLVQKPGQYLVPYRTNLITLVAFAGGFREDAKISNIKIVRHVGTNGSNGTRGKTRVYQVDVEKYFDKGDTRQIPQLMPDDTIIVSGSTTKTVNKIFDYVGKGVMLAQLYFLIRVAND
ncbi:hypothetical protein GWO43_17120 [candidate division KSB1 bacterium]|nr:hypothetical protein [candidate division KSB1 bacterium]NIR69184.1 hypothetical protein [candidate division KSB1 bacterium]NIS25695.1 hypothetical protein [candidate division KSB1 bacterium]NIT72563.1 hypothetical protein [candidate division KSB1 bacterium]NIU26372.1 hypothetical protein [candidate division KSB1 bacterium]